MEYKVTLFAAVECSLKECWSEAELKLLGTLQYRFGADALQFVPRHHVKTELVFKLYEPANQPHRGKDNTPHLGIFLFMT